VAQFDADAPAGQADLDEVHAGQEAVAAGQIGGCKAVTGAGAGREARREGHPARAAGLHLYQDEVGGGGGHQIELGDGVAQVAGQETVTCAAQMARGETLAGASA